MSSLIEKALVEWARRRLDRGPGKDRRTERFKLDDLATDIVEAVDFDTSPASQERDEDRLLERATERAACDPRHAEQHATETLIRIQRILEQPKGSIGKRKILRECRGAIVGLLARLRSGSEPGERRGWLHYESGEFESATMMPDHDPTECAQCVEVTFHGKCPSCGAMIDNGWWCGLPAGHMGECAEDEPAARPSGGEGAPEPDGDARFLAIRSYLCNDLVPGDLYVSGGADRHARALFDRLPPEREAEAREPDAWISEHDARHVEVTGYVPGALLFKEKGHNATRRVFFGTPGVDREAEIRADERRKVLDVLRKEIEYDRSRSYPTYMQTAADRTLARLSPTDEQESPTGDDR